MTSRATVLSSIRRSLGVKGNEAPRLHAVDERLKSTPLGVPVARGKREGEALLALFEERVKYSAASFTRLKAESEIPHEVSRFLRDKNLPQRLKKGDEPLFAHLPWGETPLEITQGRTHGEDLIGLSRAFKGIAETGTLTLLSGADNPTTLNFLPDYHIIVVKAEDITQDMEQAFAALRAKNGKNLMPRVLNFITGPSRSGDIEQKLLFGAHGPRSLHVILVD